MSTHELVIGIPHISCIEGVCWVCALGKHHIDPFLVGTSTHAKAPFEWIHNDLISFPTPSS